MESEGKQDQNIYDDKGRLRYDVEKKDYHEYNEQGEIYTTRIEDITEALNLLEAEKSSLADATAESLVKNRIETKQAKIDGNKLQLMFDDGSNATYETETPLPATFYSEFGMFRIEMDNAVGIFRIVKESGKVRIYLAKSVSPKVSPIVKNRWPDSSLEQATLLWKNYTAKIVGNKIVFEKIK